MNVVASILATAAVSAAAVRGVRYLRRRAALARRRAVDRRQGEKGIIIDMERDAATGVYGVDQHR